MRCCFRVGSRRRCIERCSRLLQVKRTLIAVIQYLLGFLALAVFAAIAFAPGTASDERLVVAFKVSSVVALAELAVLLYRPSPVNRLILAANLWLLAGGLAAFLRQWWWLKGYQWLGESSLFLSMLAVGLVTTVVSPAGFVATHGQPRKVFWASLALLLGVAAALAVSVLWRGDIKFAAVLPVIALSWLNRFLRATAARGA